MNQKKAKMIRKTLRAAGKDWREKVYTMVGGQYLKDKLVITGTIALAKDCGRNIYKTTKGVANV